MLSLYMSKQRRKRRRKEGKGAGVGRPKILSHPLPNKDMDSTLPFKDDFATEECETDTGQFSFQVNVQGSKENKNMAVAGEVLHLHHLPPPHPHHHLLLHQQHLISHHPILTLMVTTFGIDPMYVIVTLKLETSIWYEIWLKICTQQVAFKILCC